MVWTEREWFEWKGNRKEFTENCKALDIEVTGWMNNVPEIAGDKVNWDLVSEIAGNVKTLREKYQEPAPSITNKPEVKKGRGKGNGKQRANKGKVSRRKGVDSSR